MRLIRSTLACADILLQYSTETLAVEVLYNPMVSTTKQCLNNLLTSFTGHKHLIHAGYSFGGSGSWLLQNGVFSFSDFVEAFQEAEVQRVLRSYPSIELHVHCASQGPDWTPENFKKQAFSQYCKVELNPADCCDSVPGSQSLLECLDRAVVSMDVKESLQASVIVGNIRFNRPTLYVFPGGQGDCALFGINGFNMLIDGGFNKKPCFWEFIRHLDRLDAIMVTRLSETNMCGITTMMQRKAVNHIYPQLGYVFCNIGINKIPPPEEETSKDNEDLIISVMVEGHKLAQSLQQMNLPPHPCFRESKIEPFVLYQKVGHGTLDMYILNPPKESKEIKEFFQQWNSNRNDFGFVKSGMKLNNQELSIPLSHSLSISALLVWKPANPTEAITRILFTGSTPQNKIFEAFEKLKSLDVLKHQHCTPMSLRPTPAEKAKPKPEKIINKPFLNKQNHQSPSGTSPSPRSTGTSTPKKEASRPLTASKAPTEIAKAASKKLTQASLSKRVEDKQSSSQVSKREVKETKPVIVPKSQDKVDSKKSLADTKAPAAPKPTRATLLQTKKAADNKEASQKEEPAKPKLPPSIVAKNKMNKTKSASPASTSNVAPAPKAAPKPPPKKVEPKTKSPDDKSPKKSTAKDSKKDETVSKNTLETKNKPTKVTRPESSLNKKSESMKNNENKIGALKSETLPNNEIKTDAPKGETSQIVEDKIEVKAAITNGDVLKPEENLSVSKEEIKETQASISNLETLEKMSTILETAASIDVDTARSTNVDTIPESVDMIPERVGTTISANVDTIPESVSTTISANVDTIPESVDMIPESVGATIPANVNTIPESVGTTIAANVDTIPESVDMIPESVGATIPANVDTIPESVGTTIAANVDTIPESVGTTIPANIDTIPESVGTTIPAFVDAIPESVDSISKTDLETTISTNVDAAIPAKTDDSADQLKLSDSDQKSEEATKEEVSSSEAAAPQPPKSEAALEQPWDSKIDTNVTESISHQLELSKKQDSERSGSESEESSDEDDQSLEKERDALLTFAKMDESICEGLAPHDYQEERNDEICQEKLPEEREEHEEFSENLKITEQEIAHSSEPVIPSPEPYAEQESAPVYDYPKYDSETAFESDSYLESDPLKYASKASEEHEVTQAAGYSTEALNETGNMTRFAAPKYSSDISPDYEIPPISDLSKSSTEMSIEPELIPSSNISKSSTEISMDHETDSSYPEPPKYSSRILDETEPSSEMSKSSNEISIEPEITQSPEFSKSSTENSPESEDEYPNVASLTERTDQMTSISYEISEVTNDPHYREVEDAVYEPTVVYPEPEPVVDQPKDFGSKDEAFDRVMGEEAYEFTELKEDAIKEGAHLEEEGVSFSQDRYEADENENQDIPSSKNEYAYEEHPVVESPHLSSQGVQNVFESISETFSEKDNNTDEISKHVLEQCSDQDMRTLSSDFRSVDNDFYSRSYEQELKQTKASSLEMDTTSNMEETKERSHYLDEKEEDTQESLEMSVDKDYDPHFYHKDDPMHPPEENMESDINRKEFDSSEKFHKEVEYSDEEDNGYENNSLNLQQEVDSQSEEENKDEKEKKYCEKYQALERELDDHSGDVKVGEYFIDEKPCSSNDNTENSEANKEYKVEDKMATNAEAFFREKEDEANDSEFPNREEYSFEQMDSENLSELSFKEIKADAKLEKEIDNLESKEALESTQDIENYESTKDSPNNQDQYDSHHSDAEEKDMGYPESPRKSYRAHEHRKSDPEDAYDDDEDDYSDDGEIVRHATPPGEHNFYENIGPIGQGFSGQVNELQGHLMEQYLSSGLARPMIDVTDQPLYEEKEESDEEFKARSPIVERPVYASTLEADFPEFVTLSGGTTPSDPQSPRSPKSKIYSDEPLRRDGFHINEPQTLLPPLAEDITGVDNCDSSYSHLDASRDESSSNLIFNRAFDSRSPSYQGEEDKTSSYETTTQFNSQPLTQHKELIDQAILEHQEESVTKELSVHSSPLVGLPSDEFEMEEEASRVTDPQDIQLEESHQITDHRDEREISNLETGKTEFGNGFGTALQTASQEEKQKTNLSSLKLESGDSYDLTLRSKYELDLELNGSQPPLNVEFDTNNKLNGKETHSESHFNVYSSETNDKEILQEVMSSEDKLGPADEQWKYETTLQGHKRVGSNSKCENGNKTYNDASPSEITPESPEDLPNPAMSTSYYEEDSRSRGYQSADLVEDFTIDHSVGQTISPTLPSYKTPYEEDILDADSKLSENKKANSSRDSPDDVYPKSLQSDSSDEADDSSDEDIPPRRRASASPQAYTNKAYAQDDSEDNPIEDYPLQDPHMSSPSKWDNESNMPPQEFLPEESEQLPAGGYSDTSKRNEFHVEDWDKPMGLPSPPETRLNGSNPPSPAKRPRQTENDKSKGSKGFSRSNVSPVYVDLAYVPHHGDPNYSNVDFFERVRARYYVFSGTNPSKEVLNALLEAKKGWKEDAEVTIIPTYETDTLGYWMALNQDTLAALKIEVAPSASRCTVNLQDHETSCAAYRLEF